MASQPELAWPLGTNCRWGLSFEGSQEPGASRTPPSLLQHFIFKRARRASADGDDRGGSIAEREARCEVLVGKCRRCLQGPVGSAAPCFHTLSCSSGIIWFAVAAWEAFGRAWPCGQSSYHATNSAPMHLSLPPSPPLHPSGPVFLACLAALAAVALHQQWVPVPQWGAEAAKTEADPTKPPNPLPCTCRYGLCHASACMLSTVAG